MLFFLKSLSYFVALKYCADKNNTFTANNFAEFLGVEIFVERQSFCIVLGESTETMRKLRLRELCLSTKFPHQKIR